MRKRAKAVCPVLCLAVIVGGGTFTYLHLHDDALGDRRAAKQACDDARAKVAPNLASMNSGGAGNGMAPVLQACERQNE